MSGKRSQTTRHTRSPLPTSIEEPWSRRLKESRARFVVRPGRAVCLAIVVGAAVLSGIVLWASCRSAAEAAAVPDDILRTLRPGHPRLYVLNDELPGVRQQLASDALVRTWHGHLQGEARKILGAPVVEHKLVGPRLLDQSRKALHRISTLAGLYRLDGDRRYAERARQEMLAAAAFPDWNPPHFLDVAEMTNALAIGYDWLFDFLSAADRAAIRRAIVEKGLREGQRAYTKRDSWTQARHNWNPVCNGGMAAGALAVADEEPELAREILARTKGSIAIAMRSYAPDGGWPEGPGYWGYATRYNVFYIAGVRSALGSDFGLVRTPGFAQTGEFRVHIMGPTGRAFNFADADEQPSTASQMLWLAREFRRPLYAEHERRTAGRHPDIFHLFWSAPPAAGPTPEPELPRDAVFRGSDVAFLRSAWGDPKAFYLGFKGGDNQANHAHLDLGSFVLDALGQRWAIDLGKDSYSLPAYFGKNRWSYYRLRTEGHNTLVIDGENQDPAAHAPLVAFLSTPERSFAVADLSQAYRSRAERVLRGIALLDGRRVLVQDEVRVREPAEVVWNLHTRAQIAQHDGRAMLSQGSARLEARILEPAGAQFEVISASAPPPQAQQPDVRNLIVRVPARAAETRIAVLFAAPDGSSPNLSLEPLSAWLNQAKLSH